MASGEAAIRMILGHEGDAFSLVPDEAPLFPPVPASPADSLADSLRLDCPDEWWKTYEGDLRTLDIKALLESQGLLLRQKSERELEVVCPWAEEHTTGDSTASVLLPDPEERLFPRFRCFHAHCEHRGNQRSLAFVGRDAGSPCQRPSTDLKRL